MFRAKGLGPGVQGLGLRGFRISGLGFRGFRVYGPAV